MEGYRYKEYRQGRRFILKIMPGESLVECITRFAYREKILNAVILSAVGSVRDVRLRGIKSGAKLPITPARINSHLLEGPLELLSLTGNIIPDQTDTPDCHLHIMVGKSSCEVIGGHLFDARVFATCEIVLTELVVEGVERHHSASGGTPTIFFDEE